MLVPSSRTVAQTEPIDPHPLQVWELDFSDPDLQSAWYQSLDEARADAVVRLRFLSPRDGVGSSPILEVVGTSGLSAESSGGICLDFPQDFDLGVEDSLVLDWEWNVDDTERSGAVNIGIRHSGTRFFFPVVSSHSSFTGRAVLFDPPGSWVRHRIPIRGPLWPVGWGETHGPRAVCIGLHNPERQRVRVTRLRLERWAQDAIESDPIMGTYRATPTYREFSEKPLSSLTRAAGGALEDLDGDGMPELLVVQRQDYLHLYRNDGNGGFREEITREAGLVLALFGTGAMFVDLDGDHDSDLILLSEYDVPRLFENMGRIRFEERTPLGDDYLGAWYTAAADDVDGDGDLDLVFVAPEALKDMFVFLENLGSLQFQHRRWGPWEDLSGDGPFFATLADLNNDARPDLLMAGEHLYRNTPTGFRPWQDAWADRDRDKTEGGVITDLNNDGVLDLLVVRDATESLGGRTRILMGNGAGGFVDRTKEANLPGFDAAEVALAEDLDNDGRPDLYICQRNRPDFVLLNRGHGRFRDATDESGMGDPGSCESAIAGDVDGDGRMDVVVLREGTPPVIMRNRLQGGNWLGVMVQSQSPRDQPIGTQVRLLEAGTDRVIARQWLRRGQGFGSTGPQEMRLGLGPHETVDVEVLFPGGGSRRLSDVRGDQTILVRRPGEGLATFLGRFEEAAFPLKRRFLQRFYSSAWLRWVLAVVAFGVTLPLIVPVRRLASLTVIGVGAMLTLWLGGTGSAATGVPAAGFWAAGALSGIAALGIGVLIAHLAQRQPSINDLEVQVESLMQSTLDFRHAGTEARALLSIHGRVQNLFLHDQPHAPFLAELVQRAPEVRQFGVPRLARLADAVVQVFPQITLARDLRQNVAELSHLLAELTRVQRDPERLKQWRARILPVLESLQELLPQVLDQVDQTCSFPVDQAVQEAIVSRSQDLRRAGVSVTTLPAPDPASLRGVLPRSSLLLIIDNLLTNSIRAMAERPEEQKRQLTIQLSATVSRIQVDFSDSGPGVPESVESRIFEPGYSQTPGGRGYGLARSRELLGHFGGGIRFVRNDTAGATFVVVVRRAPDPAPMAAKKTGSSQG